MGEGTGSTGNMGLTEVLIVLNGLVLLAIGSRGDLKVLFNVIHVIEKEDGPESKSLQDVQIRKGNYN